MKAGLITHPNSMQSDRHASRRLVAPLERLDAARYSRRSWRRRLPAVLFASLLIVFVLFAAGITLDGAPLLVLVPFVCLPLAAAVALGSS